MKVHYYYLLSALCVWTSAKPVAAQFYYSVVEPQFPFVNPFVQHQPLFYQQFNGANVFAQQVQQPQPQQLQQQQQPQAQQQSQLQLPQARLSPAPISGEFHGFGYRTEYTDGATSTVFYLTGGDEERAKIRDFPDLLKKIQPLSPLARARSLKSETTDNGLLQPAQFDKLFEHAGLVNFYTYPASTAPLIASTNATADSEPTTTTQPITTTSENETAESILSAKVLINDLENRINKNLNSTTSNTTTTSTSTILIDVPDEPTTLPVPNSVEVTTLESNTTPA